MPHNRHPSIASAASICALFLLASLGAGPASAAKVYKCPSPQGEVTYSDQPCPGGEPMEIYIAFRSGAHDNAFYYDLWATLSAGRVYRGTIVNRKKNGDVFHSEQTITPIRDTTGNLAYFVSVGRDMTARRKAEEQERHHLAARAVQRRLLPAIPLAVLRVQDRGCRVHRRQDGR